MGSIPGPYQTRSSARRLLATSLLAIGEASVDRTFAHLQRHDLAGGAWVEHVPGWLAGADEVFAQLLATVPWAQHERHMYSGKVVEPRLRASWSLGGDSQGGPGRAPHQPGLPPRPLGARS